MNPILFAAGNDGDQADETDKKSFSTSYCEEYSYSWSKPKYTSFAR
jgi:hypothetical protein